jgi:lycopene cyclase domain-containing protein
LSYIVLILLWALPVIGLEFLIGGDILLRRWRIALPAILLPTCWLTVIDALASGAGFQLIDINQTLPVRLPLLNVPLEQTLFYGMTNTMLVCGLLLVSAPLMRQRLRTLFSLLRRGPSAFYSADKNANDSPEAAPSAPRKRKPKRKA